MHLKFMKGIHVYPQVKDAVEAVVRAGLKAKTDTIIHNELLAGVEKVAERLSRSHFTIPPAIEKQIEELCSACM